MEIELSRQLKITHLRLIIAIGECGQLNLAAEQLAMTQPAASRMLADIENIFGTRLFNRHARGMTATLVGQALLRRARRLLLDFRDISREVDELKQGRRGQASVGAVTGAAVGYVIPAVQQLKAVSPGAEIQINVESSPVLMQGLLDGHNDFVLARLPAHLDAADFDISPAHTELVQLVVREDHPLADARQIPIADLKPYEWVIQTHRAPMRDAVDNAFIEAEVSPPTNVINTTSLLVMISFLVSSSAIAPLASEVANLLIGDRVKAKLKALDTRETIEVSPYYLIQMRNRSLSPVANRLKALITASLGN